MPPKVGADDAAVAGVVLDALPEEDVLSSQARPKEVLVTGPLDSMPASGWGGGDFLGQETPPLEELVIGILGSEGSGVLGGEEKSGKTYYALEEALCLAMAWQVCGRFEVP